MILQKTPSYLIGASIILLFWIVVGNFTVNIIDVKTSDSNLNFAIKLIPAVTGCIGSFIIVRYYHRKNILSFIVSKKSIEYRKIAIGFFVFLFLIGLLHLFYLRDLSTNIEFNIFSFFGLFLTFWSMMLLQILLEEFFFRGYLYHGILSKTSSKFLSVLLPSILFGLLHWGSPSTEKFGNSILISYVWMGLIFGIIRSLDSSLELSIGGHLANNFFLCAFAQPNWQSLNLSSFYINEVNITSLELILFQTILGGLFFISLYRIYQWPFLDFFYSKKN